MSKIDILKRYYHYYGMKMLLLKLFRNHSAENFDYDSWLKKNAITEAELEKQKKYEFAYNPKISIIVPTYETPEMFLREMIESVQQQTYSNWELCIADGSVSDQVMQVIQAYAQADKRIIVKKLTKNKGIADNTNVAIAIASGEYIALLENPDISQETKDYINGRLQNIMADNENMSERVKKAREWYQPKDDNTAEQPGWLEQRKADFHKVLLEEKNNYKVMAEALMDGISNHRSKESGAKLSQATWEQLRKEAETEGHKLSDGNDYGMFDSVYKGTYQTLIANGKHKNPKYTLDSMEFSDLECFLSICREEGIEPLVVILPFNGYWYDYTELTAEERSTFYEKIRCIAEDYGVQCADLSGNEYTEYYFEDNSHPALKGLVDLNEAIYEFYRKDKTE